MARLKDIVIDADHPARLARFWAAAIDGYDVAPYDDAEVARLTALGLTPETDPVVMVEGPGPRLCFHLRPGERPALNRVHLDLVAADLRAEIERLCGLGATVRRVEAGYTVLADPEGNNFCVFAS